MNNKVSFATIDTEKGKGTLFFNGTGEQITCTFEDGTVEEIGCTATCIPEARMTCRKLYRFSDWNYRDKFYPTVDTRNHLNLGNEPFPVTDESAYLDKVYRNKRSGVECILAVRPFIACDERFMKKIAEQYEEVDA